MRYQDEEHTLLPPGSFFPLLEQNGLMPLLDRWVVGSLGKWLHSQRSGSGPSSAPRSSINVSRQTLRDRQFPGFVRKHIEIGQLPADRFAFELAPEANGGLGGVQAFADEVARAGCGVVLCDFDGSDPSMQALSCLKPQFVKLSPSLLKQLRAGSREYDRLSALNATCHAMGMQTIAERVEDQALIALVRSIGIDYVQGFSVAAPRPLE